MTTTMPMSMKTTRTALLLSSILTLTPLAGLAGAGEPTAFETLTGHYEQVRQALVHDHLDGVADEARQLAAAVRRLEEDFSVERAGVEPADAVAVQELLPELASAADELAAAGDVGQAREAFSKLSRALVRYRKRVADADLKVLYCPMASKSWLQPEAETEVGNPYYGGSMATCGEVLESKS